jgi:hypothetical protein
LPEKGKNMNTLKTNTLLTIAAIAFLFLLFPTKVYAYDYVPSAILQELQNSDVEKSQPSINKDTRTHVLQAYLEKQNSPLAAHAKTFIDSADQNNLDWKLVAAISGVESYFGQQIPANSYNGWGYGVYGNNVRRFESWDDGIITVSQAIRNDYMNKWGAQNVFQIGQVYAADPRWAGKVLHFITQIEEFEQTYQENTASTKLSLSL